MYEKDFTWYRKIDTSTSRSLPANRGCGMQRWHEVGCFLFNYVALLFLLLVGMEYLPVSVLIKTRDNTSNIESRSSSTSDIESAGGSTSNIESACFSNSMWSNLKEVLIINQGLEDLERV